MKLITRKKYEEALGQAERIGQEHALRQTRTTSDAYNRELTRRYKAEDEIQTLRRELAFANDRIARLIHTPEPPPRLVVNQYQASEEPTS